MLHPVGPGGAERVAGEVVEEGRSAPAGGAEVGPDTARRPLNAFAVTR